MHRVTFMDTEQRYLRFKEILLDKCSNLTNENLDIIISSINIKRIYLIKSTNSEIKFLNIATAECIHTTDKKTISYIIPILGNFEPGYYINVDNSKESAPGRLYKNSTSAALKMSVTCVDGHPKITYILAVYAPK